MSEQSASIGYKEFPKREINFDGDPVIRRAEESLFDLVNNEKVAGREGSASLDAIIWIEGDSHDRVQKCLELYRQGGGDVPLVLSGGAEGNALRPDADKNPDGGNIPSWKIMDDFLAEGVPLKNIFLEERSKHAQGQATYVIEMARSHGWKRIALVASPWHQSRIFLTFLKELQKQNALDIEIVNQSGARFSAEREIPGRSKTSSELIPEELGRLDTYIPKGDVAFPEEGLVYLLTFPEKSFVPARGEEESRVEEEKTRRPMRDIDTIIGQLYSRRDVFFQSVGKEESELNIREKLGLDIIDSYLPFRHRIQSEMSEEERVEVQKGIRIFAEKRFDRAYEAHRQGDIPALFMALHNAATGFGMSGDTAMQVRINKILYARLSQYPRDADLDYIYQKVFSGLLENDPEFQKTFPLEEHIRFISQLEMEESPNFAGRSIALAKRLLSLGRADEAIQVLERSAVSKKSKQIQVEEAQRELAILKGFQDA